MSHEATNWAIKQRGLKPSAKILLWHLCDRYNPDHGCFPSQHTLADDCETDVRTIRRQLKVLEDAGLIRKEHRKGAGGMFNSDRYFLAFEAGFTQRTKRPADKLTVGQKVSPPADKNGQNHRTKCPPNPVREPLIEPVKGEPDQVGYLSQVLSQEIAEAFVASRKAMKKPMTVFAAKLMAERLANMPNAEAEAKRAIRNGWQDVYPEKKSQQSSQDDSSKKNRWTQLADSTPERRA